MHAAYLNVSAKAASVDDEEDADDDDNVAGVILGKELLQFRSI